MKLLDLIRPSFGAIGICRSYLGDSRKEHILDQYDKDGWTRMDANYHLFAKLDLEDSGFDEGFVRFEYDGNDSLVNIVLDVIFEDSLCMRWSNYSVLYDYLLNSDYFDDCSRTECWTFRNGINEVYCEVLDHELLLKVYPPSASGIEPMRNYELGVFRTVSNLIRGERDDWKEYLLESSKNKVLLTYGRQNEDYPRLWLILTDDEVKMNPSVTTEDLRPETLRMRIEKAGMKWENWTEGMIHCLIQGPNGKEPMELLDVEDGNGEAPMTETQLDEALNRIEYLDNLYSV